MKVQDGPAVLGAVDARAELGHVFVFGVGLLLVALAEFCWGWKPCLDDGHEDLGIRAGDGQADAADLARRKALGQLCPGGAAVGRLEDAAVRAAGIEAPGLAQTLPEGDVEGVGVGRVHDQVDGPGLAVVGQSAGELGPGCAAVGRLEQAAVAGVAPGMAGGRDIDDIRIGRMGQHAGDRLRRLRAPSGRTSCRRRSICRRRRPRRRCCGRIPRPSRPR